MNTENRIRLANYLRVAIADDPDLARDLLLSPQQAEVLLAIRHSKRSSWSSRLVCKRFGFSAQHACMVLDKLYRKGYLCRTSQPQESGGYEYEYTWELTNDTN